MSNLIRALLMSVLLAFAQLATASSPEETVRTWVQAMKRNDFNAMLLLMTTPEEYIRLRDELLREMPCRDKETHVQSYHETFDEIYAADTPERWYAKWEHFLPEANSYRDQYAALIGNFVDLVFLSDGLVRDDPSFGGDQQAAAVEVSKALSNWAGRTDFSDPKRFKGLLSNLISNLKLEGIDSPQQCLALTPAQWLKKMDVFPKLIKDILLAYDLNVDRMLASISVRRVGPPKGASPGTVYVEISYKIFESRGKGVFAMYQREGEWFFSEGPFH